MISLSEKTPKNDSWIETREYPGSRLQLIPFLVMMILAVVFFLLFSKGEISISAAFFLIFASLTFSVAVFPQYLEFSGMSGALVAQGMAKARRQKGLRRFIPPVTSSSVLLVLQVVLVFIAPPSLFWGSLTGIMAGFASSRLVFTLYVRYWSRSRGLKVSSYSMASRNEHGSRVVLEYGLKAVRV